MLDRSGCLKLKWSGKFDLAEEWKYEEGAKATPQAAVPRKPRPRTLPEYMQRVSLGGSVRCMLQYEPALLWKRLR